MPFIKDTILAPELQSGEWVQGGPLRLSDSHDRHVVLIDFWDYTCVNCIRTLPYVAEWHRRYLSAGLIVVGVHAPEFTFARDMNNVLTAIRQFKLAYPIVLDNGYEIWRAYSNRCWPAKYLVDQEGRLRYYHFGEGGYADTELAIQRLLYELDATLEFLPPVSPLRASDQPGAVCYRVTPELYLGYMRGQFGNPEAIAQDRLHTYRDPGHHMEGLCYLAGDWTIGSESARAEGAGATLGLRYTAMDVNLVLAPPAFGSARIELQLSEGQRAGADVIVEHNRMFLTIDQPRMYSLVQNDSVTSGSLKLLFHDPAVSAFAFTFISCPVN
jgi:thiol-disulfide isomerase/thioredoxin